MTKLFWNLLLGNLLLGCFLACTTVFSQSVYEYNYWIYFTDKTDSPYTINEPTQFLSERAIERRVRQNILLTEEDLPVNPAYISAVQNSSTQLNFLHTSRWFNAMAISFTDTVDLINTIPPSDYPLLADIFELDFVSGIELLAFREATGGKKMEADESLESLESLEVNSTGLTSSHFGYSANQICMLNGDDLHLYGFDGDGILIAVLDNGFPNVDSLPAFNNIFEGNRFKGGIDLVELDGDLFNNPYAHGGRVLSVLAADVPGDFVGAAPNADYLLFITEDDSREERIEEVNWVVASEFADSAGADIINASLGYFDSFDYYGFDYSYEDLDGQTSIITQAADIAATKGMLVVTSAGNEGNKNWEYATFPADADSVLSVGSVSGEGNYSAFSSVGPTYDNRIKPEIVAQGEATAVLNPYSEMVQSAQGTSYSTPIIAGLAASLWESNPHLSASGLRRAIIESASQFESPDNFLGYGLPDFRQAFDSVNEIPLGTNEEPFFAYPNPVHNQLNLFYVSSFSGILRINLLDTQGRLVGEKRLPVNRRDLYNIDLSEEINYLPKGVYFIQFNGLNGSEALSIVKM